MLYIGEVHSVSSRECRIETMKETNMAHDISRLYMGNVSWSSLSTLLRASQAELEDSHRNMKNVVM